MEPVYRFVYRRRIEFAETDMAGIAHFSNFFRYMEVTEHAFYRSLGFSVHEFRPGPGREQIGWPRVHAEADFKLRLEFEEEIEVELLVEEIRTRSVKYLFRFWKTPEGDRRLAATGRFVVVCVQLDSSQGTMQAIPVPDTFRERVSVAPPEELAVKA